MSGVGGGGRGHPLKNCCELYKGVTYQSMSEILVVGSLNADLVVQPLPQRFHKYHTKVMMRGWARRRGGQYVMCRVCVKIVVKVDLCGELY